MRLSKDGIWGAQVFPKFWCLTNGRCSEVRLGTRFGQEQVVRAGVLHRTRLGTLDHSIAAAAAAEHFVQQRSNGRLGGEARGR